MLAIHGIIVAMVTPFTNSGELNEPALRRLTEHLIANGVHGLFVAGSQGEFWALTAEEKKRAWEVVLDEAAGRVPVYAGTGAVTTREAVALTQLAEAVGVSAVSVITPMYISPTDDELHEHYRIIASATRLPVILYSNPARTGVRVSPRLVARLASIENIAGVKDSSGELELTAEIIRTTPPAFVTLVGRDTLIYGALLHGAKGAVAACANVAPALTVRIYDCFRAGDLEGAHEAQAALSLLRLAFSWGTFPIVIKEALNLMGFDAGPARPPVGPLSAEQRERLKGVLREMQLI